MPTTEYYHPYTHGAPSSYASHATHGWRGSQTAPSTSRHTIYHDPAWNREHGSRARTPQQTYDDSASESLTMQEELDLAQAIANSAYTAEREARLRRERETPDRRQSMRSIHSNASTSSLRSSRHSRTVPDAPPQVASNPSFRAKRYVRNPSASPAEKLFEYDTLFTADFTCPRCAQLIITSRLRSQRYSPSVISLLHVRCTKCSTVFCRGCAMRTECSSRCAGGDRCPLTKCCHFVRAIAVFEVLSDLDRAYTSKAATLADSSPPSQSQREDYLELAISRADSMLSTAFDSFLLHALTELNYWMPEKPGPQPGNVHPSVALLLSASYILEIVHHFLSHPKVAEWVIRADIYLQILILMRTLAARHGLNYLVMQPRSTKQACGLHNIIWTQGKILWEDGTEGISPSLYNVILSPTRDRPQDLLKLQESMRSSHLKERAWSLQKQIQYIQCLQISGPDY